MLARGVERAVRKPPIPVRARQVPEYFVAGNSVPTSAIYQVFHSPGCVKEPKREALWAGDTFPAHGCCGHEVRYRFLSLFDLLDAQ